MKLNDLTALIEQLEDNKLFSPATLALMAVEKGLITADKALVIKTILQIFLNMNGLPEDGPIPKQGMAPLRGWLGKTWKRIT